MASVADSPGTQQLVERVRAGSMDALANLYDAHAASVYRVAYRLLQSVADAEDVVQDVFLGLPRALRSYRAEAGLDSWIRQVAARTALMRLRSQRRRREEPDTLQGGEPVGAAAVVAHPVERIALDHALAALPDTFRTVFVLKVVEGYSHDEIATLLDITPLASRARLARARRQLERLLQQD